MYDKFDGLIYLKPEVVNHLQTRKEEVRNGFVDYKLYDFPINQKGKYHNGIFIADHENPYAWEKIDSSISNIAFGFYPEGNTFNPYPHVRVKFSPSKILQGHNAFGPEHLEEGVNFALLQVQNAFPKLFQHLDIPNMEIMWLDTTYSALLKSEHHLKQAFDFLENLASSRQKTHKDYLYLLFGKNSQYKKQKFYYKLLELYNQLKEAERHRQLNRIKVLKDKRLEDFCYNRLRCEGSLGRKFLIANGIPHRYADFLKYTKWFETCYPNETVCQYLWKQNFESIFSKLEGHTMFKHSDDDIRAKIDAIYITYHTNLQTGKVTSNKRKANAVFDFYQKLRSMGWKHVKKNTPHSSFDRNKECLKAAGLSEAYLRSLNPKNEHASNVVPLVNVINVDFSNQTPDWYVKPTAHSALKNFGLRAVN